MMLGEISVLDHGFVRLVDSVPTEDGAGDARIVQAARVSYAGETKRLRSDDGLIRYLVRNRHTTPLEQVIYTFHVKCPISVARQFMRHRTWSFNESSTRYRKVAPDECYLPLPERMQRQDVKNRQGSGDQLIDDTEMAIAVMEASNLRSFNTYERLLQMGLAREVARGVLPLDTYTEFYGTIDLHNLMHFLGLRLDAHAQWEIRQYAQALEELASPLCPVAFEAWHQPASGESAQ